MAQVPSEPKKVIECPHGGHEYYYILDNDTGIKLCKSCLNIITSNYIISCVSKAFERGVERGIKRQQPWGVTR